MPTFADMATLLMAFFVMILSFAEMNVPKFKQISGTMKNSFGVQRLIPTVEQPKATSVIAQNFLRRLLNLRCLIPLNRILLMRQKRMLS